MRQKITSESPEGMTLSDLSVFVEACKQRGLSPTVVPKVRTTWRGMKLRSLTVEWDEGNAL
jgi:hypothetical protein